MDTKTKMREDPLFAIRMMEENAKKRLLENPVKMQQLQKTIQKQNLKNKKSKQQKHRKHSDSDSNDDDLVSKYLNILNAKHKDSKNVMASDENKRRNAKKMLDNKEETYERKEVSSDKLHDERRSEYKSRNERRERDYPKGRTKDKKRYRGNCSSSCGDIGNQGEERDTIYKKYDVRYHKDFDSRKGHDGESKHEKFKEGTDKKYDKQKWKISIPENDSDNERKKHKSRRHKMDGGKEIKNSSCRKRRHSSSSSGNQQSENMKYKSGTNRSEQARKEKGNKDHSLSPSSSAEDTDHIYKNHNQDSSSDSALSHSGNSGNKSASKRQLSDSDNEKYEKAKTFGLVILNSEALEAQKKNESSSRSWNRKPKKEEKPQQATKSSSSLKLTDEEKQKQVEEMMKNAKWWEDQRKKKSNCMLLRNRWRE